ncbi:MAG: hypothetical protein N3D12_03935 [Candidatus Methanomethyliaceae archaeon]|nr:hypothetical protein [Candidatus Methanomethyliaceae archaeon]
MFESLLNKKVLAILGTLFMIMLTSGGIYLIIMQPGDAVQTITGTSFIARSSTNQTRMEFFASFFLTLIGVAGFIFLEEALRKTFDLSGAKMKYLVAVILVLISLGLMEYLLWVKFH